MYLYGLKEDLIVRHELNPSEKVILCSGDNVATCKLYVEYDAIFDEPYATTITELYAGTMLIPYTKAKLIH